VRSESADAFVAHGAIDATDKIVLAKRKQRVAFICLIPVPAAFEAHYPFLIATKCA
jgi:hypothetical protein